MESQNFCYWLKGFFEISSSNELTEKQVKIIRDHLDLVFKKVTPDREVEKTKDVLSDISFENGLNDFLNKKNDILFCNSFYTEDLSKQKIC